MFDLIKQLIAALNAGVAVTQKENWKRAQIIVPHLVAIGTAAAALAKFAGHDVGVTYEQLTAIATGLFTVVSLFNHAATVVSTTTIDALGRSASPPAPAASDVDGNGSGSSGRTDVRTGAQGDSLAGRDSQPLQTARPSIDRSIRGAGDDGRNDPFRDQGGD